MKREEKMILHNVEKNKNLEEERYQALKKLAKEKGYLSYSMAVKELGGCKNYYYDHLRLKELIEAYSKQTNPNLRTKKSEDFVIQQLKNQISRLQEELIKYRTMNIDKILLELKKSNEKCEELEKANKILMDKYLLTLSNGGTN